MLYDYFKYVLVTLPRSIVSHELNLTKINVYFNKKILTNIEFVRHKETLFPNALRIVALYELF